VRETREKIGKGYSTGDVCKPNRSAMGGGSSIENRGKSGARPIRHYGNQFRETCGKGSKGKEKKKKNPTGKEFGDKKCSGTQRRTLMRTIGDTKKV